MLRCSRCSTSSLDLHPRVAGAVTSGTWVASTRFPSLTFVAGVAAATVVGKPWLSRSWKRASDLALLGLIVAMAIAGSGGVPELILACGAGACMGAAVLIAFGSPNRRPAPSVVAAALGAAGLDLRELALERVEGGRSQLYRATTDNGDAFVKVYAEDSRDADLLYRGYRTLLLRGPNDDWPSLSLEHDVEHEALMLLMARNGGVRCPSVEVLTTLDDGSVALAMEDVPGTPLDQLAPDEIDDALLDAVWREASALHRARIAHRALHPSNILVAAGVPTIIDMDFAKESASPRLQAIDRAELLTSLAEIAGAERVVASAQRVIGPSDLASASPFLQPLALSARTRKPATKALLQELRTDIAAVTGEEPPPLERLIRVNPRTLLMIAVSVGAFYFLLPQLANVGDSFTALRSANFWWLAVCVVMSLLTYVASAIGQQGGVPGPLPFVANVGASAASSFVNRVTPANIGGMALNVRFMQKAGIEPAQAVTGMGLNVLAGGVVHAVLLVLFLAWAGQSSSGFKIPSSSKVLVFIVILLGDPRRRRRDPMGTPPDPHQGVPLLSGVVEKPGRVVALTAEARDVVRRVGGSDARLHRGARGGGRRVRRRPHVRAGRCRVPGRVRRCRGRADPGWSRCDGSRARRRSHRCRDGPGRSRGGGPQLPARHLLAADPARMDQLPHPRTSQLHLGSRVGEGRCA